MLLSVRFPILYSVSIFKQRLFNSIQTRFSARKFSRSRSAELLPERMFRHQSLLLRKLGNSDMQLQHNKIQNLRVATTALDGLIIKPGETFSLWKTIGLSTRKKGYVEGMLLANGTVRVGVGGGLCQLANLLYWMALHSPLEVVERYHHNFDAFPDSGRTLPFGSGATIFYNYIDLKIYNSTEQPWQLHVWVADEHLKGEIRCATLPKNAYSVVERDHAFVREADGRVYRKNVLWRIVYERNGGRELYAEQVTKNHAEVKYELDPSIIVEAAHQQGMFNQLSKI